ncbi:unnamed protein product [Effrenium voratum]|nr:unnamed protein product [Effrenium voratum]
MLGCGSLAFAWSGNRPSPGFGRLPERIGGQPELRRKARLQRSAGTRTPANERRTPLWTLKVTQMLLFAANVCFARFITVYYDHIGLSRKLMGFLLVVTPMMSFVGGMFWSIVVDITGKYKLILTSSGLLAVALVFSYLLPAVGKSWPLLLGITFVQGFLTSPAGPVVDGLCLKVLKEQTGPQEKKEEYGDQRLWSAVGWGGMAIAAGKLVDMYGVNAIFFCYGILVCINVLVIQLFISDAPKAARQGQTTVSTRQWLKTLCKFEPLWMLLNLLIYGILIALIESFLNVFLVQDFDHAPKVIIGAATAVMCLFEIPVFKYISSLWTKRGYSLVGVLWFAEFVMALRCLLYAVVPKTQPWLVLLIEPLHGFTFAAVWNATVEYAQRLATPGTEAKMQALINGLYFNVAFAVGSLLWGYWSQMPPAGFGFKRCFLIDAALTLIWLVIWAAGFALARARRRSKARLSQNVG